MNSAKERFDFCETIVRVLDGRVTAEEFAAFEKQLVEDAEARTLYFAVLEAKACLQKPGSLFRINAVGEDEESGFRPDLWQSLARMEREAPALPVERASSKPEVVQKVVYEKPDRPLRTTSVAAVIAASAALLLIALFVQLSPMPEYHGQITNLHEAVFAGSGSGLQPGENLDGRPVELKQGLVRIRMDDGSIVHLEAPVAFRLEADDQVFLDRGQLTANIENGTVGFTVRTPTASVVDYGTEFGVRVDPEIGTEAHVLKGSVEMRLGTNLRVFEQAVRLSANEAARAADQSLLRIPAAVNRFTYEMPSAFETAAGQLDPLLYFRLKGSNLQTFCETTGRGGFDIRTAPDVQVVPGPAFGGDAPVHALQTEGAAGVEVRNVLPVFTDQSGDFTVACWVRFDQIRQQVLWSNRVVSDPGGAGAYDRILWMNEQGRLEHTAYFPEYPKGTRRVNSVTASEALTPGQWYWVAVTHANWKHKLLYINGRPAAKSTGRQEYKLEKYSDLTFGKAIEGFAPGLTGAVADILFFSRDLSEQEIQTLYEAAAAR